MTRALIVLVLVFACIGCVPSRPNNQAGQGGAVEPVSGGPEAGGKGDKVVPFGNGGAKTFTVFLTGNTLSTLKPCGCSQGQLGGFDRRDAVLKQVPDNARLVVDTGNMLAGQTEQDIIKLGVIVQALSILRYDIVNFNKTDFACLGQLGLAEKLPFEAITSVAGGEGGGVSMPAVSRKQLKAGEITLGITVVSVDTVPAETIAERMGATVSSLRRQSGRACVNIVIVSDFSEPVKLYFEGLDGVDVVVCPSASDEPEVLNRDKKGQRPLFLTTGRLGKYVGRLSITVKSPTDIVMDYQKEAVSENLPQNSELADLYKYYQVQVRQAGLLERYPKVPLGGELEYIGSRSCNLCHKYEYEKWSANPHAQAYKTLRDVGSQYDPECIACHVVGYQYDSGFVNEKTQDDLRNVGCEVCHGPGSRHLIAHTMDEADKMTVEPKVKCIDCHSPQHSPGYQGHEEEYLNKIVHWRELKYAKPVQKQ